MKQEIDIFDYSGQVIKTVGTGALLMTKNGDKVNAMSIGWGAIGIEWNKPVFVVYVRESRCTKEMLDANPNFTISVPMGGDVKKIISVCGTKSGYDMDKVTELGLTLEEASVNGVPGVKELPLTIECKVIFKQQQKPDTMVSELLEDHYSGKLEGNFHTAYYGEIVAAYKIV